MPLNNDFLLVIDSAGLGDGEPDLGEKLMKAFLDMLLESGDVPVKIIFMNSGVFLTTEGSPVLETLARYAEAGTALLSCGTCLAYYGRKEKLCLGGATNMRDTVEAMLKYGKVLTP